MKGLHSKEDRIRKEWVTNIKRCPGVGHMVVAIPWLLTCVLASTALRLKGKLVLLGKLVYTCGQLHSTSSSQSMRIGFSWGTQSVGVAWMQG